MIVLSTKVKRWTKKEERYLLKHYSEKSIKFLEKKLNATSKQIKQKMYKMTGSSRVSVSANKITTHDIKTYYGICSKTTLRSIENGELRATPAPKGGNRAKYLIEPSDFYEWIHSKPHIIRNKKIVRNVILPEPVWLDEFLSKERYKASGTDWTEEEDKILLYYRERRYKTYGEISEMLGRSERALSKRYVRILDSRKKKIKK